MGQKEIQNIQFIEKKGTGKFNIRANAYVRREAKIVKEISTINKRPYFLKARPHQLS